MPTDFNLPELGEQIESGDVLRVERVKPTYANSIQVDGHVMRPDAVQYRTGIRLTDVIPSVADLRPNADQRYVLIRREQVGTRRIQVVSADLAAAWLAPQTDANPLLAPRDRVVVFDLEAGREPLRSRHGRDRRSPSAPTAPRRGWSVLPMPGALGRSYVATAAR